MGRGYYRTLKSRLVLEHAIWRPGVVALTLLFCVGLASPAHAVDGVIEINQARSLAGGVTPGDVPGFPVTISESGSYRLTSNLEAEGPQGEACLRNGGGNLTGCLISILADSVELDLNGFEIVGDGFRPTGIAAGLQSEISVSNGTIRETSTSGIIVGGLNSRVQNMKIIDTGTGGTGTAIFAGGGCIVSGNTLDNVLSVGIQGEDGCIITGNTINRGADFIVGISVRGSGCTISGNVINETNTAITVFGSACVITGNSMFNNLRGINSSFGDGGHLVTSNVVRGRGAAGSVGDFGLTLEPTDGYADNVLTGNNAGAEVQVSGGIEIGTNLCGTDTICP